MRHSLLFFLLLGMFSLKGQDIEQTVNTVAERLEDRPVQVSGGLALGTQWASISGAPARYDNFDWNLQAQLTVDVLGFQVPFSAFLSDRNRLYNLPSYQFVGLSPRYKWLTLHAGDRSMNFNPYTFANQQFRGVGVELTPGKWRFAGMYGRLNRLQLGDFFARQDLQTRYERMGVAAEAGYQGERFALKAILFQARDQLPDTLIGDIRGLAPAENTVGSVEGSVLLAKRLTLSGTYALSWITEDRTSPLLPDSLADPLFGDRAATTRESAVRVTAAYALDKSVWQLAYERLSPNYRSLGTLYLTPDRENLTAGTALQFAENKVTVSLNGGLQRNNLLGDRQQTQRRVIGQVTVAARPGERTGITLNLSNFNATSRLRGYFDPLSATDSIFLAQINRSARLGFTLSRPKERAPGSLSINASVTDAQSIRDDTLTNFRNTLYNAYLGYAGQLAGGGLSYQAQLLYGYTRASLADNRVYGPSVALSKTFADDKLQLSLTGSYSIVDYADRAGGSVLLSRLAASYRVGGTGMLQSQLQFTDRADGDDRRLTETLLTLTYAWNF